MEFIYTYADAAENHELAIHIDKAAGRLFRKLKNIDVDSLDISDYNKRYLRERLKNLHRTLQMYTYILFGSVVSVKKSLDEIVFCDYGGGSGILSLLGKELGLGTVIYNDIYDVSCRDAQVVGDEIGNTADHYVHGDIDEVINFLGENAFSLDAFASCDVIEHVYDVKLFFRKLPFLSNADLHVVMSSHANNTNPIIRYILKRKQIAVEHQDREKKWGHKERDCLRSFYKVRDEMIRQYCNNNLTGNEVELLTKATRGLQETDIKKTVDEYLRTRQLPPMPGHATNTCDPFTGNWTEHLLPPHYFKSCLSKAGFEVKLLKGYYGYWDNIFIRPIALLVDLANYVTREQGIRFAPFFMVCGTKRKE